MDNPADMRSNRNEYGGYIAGDVSRPGRAKIRLDFNPTIEVEAGKTNRIDRFNLRMFEYPEGWARGEKGIEIGVSMTVEQWQDLIDAMKAELESAREWRAQFDEIDGSCGADEWD